MRAKTRFEPDAMYNEERQDWLRLTPVQRYLESCKLWDIYIGYGGSLDPEPDSQSPFNFPEMRSRVSSDGRPVKKELERWRRGRTPQAAGKLPTPG